MSWSIHGIDSMPADAAANALAKQNLPEPILEYCTQGIEALVEKYGDDTTVTVTGHGHLCKGDYEITSATLEVKRGLAVKDEFKPG